MNWGVKRYKQALYDKLVWKFSKLDRMGISANFIKGEGIEIGALNIPLYITADARVKYVDRITAEEHTSIFKDMKLENIVPVDIIDDGDTLSKIPDRSQDFVIANHFIEHCENPIMTIKNLLRVLRGDGILFMAIPDKRYTFDIDRAETSMDHFLRDYREGPSWSEDMHYDDFVRKTEWSRDCKTAEDIAKVIRHLKDINFSIHFHVWTHSTMIDFFQLMRHELSFPFEMILSVAPHHGSNESIFILKAGHNI
jgi:SAM-dependent methyltransferase